MEAAEGKLFRPLAFTKTFALLATFILSIVVLPTLAHWVLGIRSNSIRMKRIWSIILVVAGVAFSIYLHSLFPIALSLLGINKFFEDRWAINGKSYYNSINVAITILFATCFLAKEWLPLGTSNGTFFSFLFVIVIIGVLLGGMPVIYTELSMAFADLDDVDRAVDHMRLKFVEIPKPALYLAGKAFVKYRRRRWIALRR
jgi:Cu(I)/Ag(I) efflux system membrane protein CusA/SilA